MVNLNYLNNIIKKKISSKMFKRVAPLLLKRLPALLKISAFSFSYLYLNYHQKMLAPTKCFQVSPFQSNIFGEILPKIIRIQEGGEIVGYAYCFAERLLVSPSHELHDKRSSNNNYEFYIGDTRIDTKFKVIGKFENLTFLETEDNVVPVLPSKATQLYTPIHVIQYRSHLSIRDGYYVDNESGYGVISAKGEVGSLVMNEGGMFGIVSQIGRDADYGFLRVVLWKDIKNAARRLKNQQKGGIYLGMSVVASDKKTGVSVVRVAPNSPLTDHIKMGDVITKINNHPVKNPNDLTRLIMFSDKKVVLQIEMPDRNKKLVTLEL